MEILFWCKLMNTVETISWECLGLLLSVMNFLSKCHTWMWLSFKLHCMQSVMLSRGLIITPFILHYFNHYFFIKRVRAKIQFNVWVWETLHVDFVFCLTVKFLLLNSAKQFRLVKVFEAWNIKTWEGGSVRTGFKRCIVLPLHRNSSGIIQAYNSGSLIRGWIAVGGRFSDIR